jgi:hypothetical protein
MKALFLLGVLSQSITLGNSVLRVVLLIYAIRIILRNEEFLVKFPFGSDVFMGDHCYS